MDKSCLNFACGEILHAFVIIGVLDSLAIISLRKKIPRALLIALTWASSRENLSSGFPTKRVVKPVSSATETSWKIEISPVASVHMLLFKK